MITSAKFITSATNLSQSPNFALSEVAFLGRSNVGKSSLINALTRQKNLAKSSSTPGKTRLINFFEVSFKGAEYKAKFADENTLKAEFQGKNSQNSLSSQNDEGKNSPNAPQSQSNERENAECAPQNSQNLPCSQNDGRFTLIFVDLPGFGYAKVSRTQRQEWDKNLDEFLRKRTAIKLFVHLIDARHENLALDEQISEYLQSVLTPTQQILKVFTKADKLNQSQKAKLKKAFGKALLVSSATKQGLDELENALVSQSLGL